MNDFFFLFVKIAYKLWVLVVRSICLQLDRSFASVFHPLIHNLFKSSSTLSPKIDFDLPVHLLPSGFQMKNFLGTLLSSIRLIYPNHQIKRLILINLVTFGLPFPVVRYVKSSLYSFRLITGTVLLVWLNTTFLLHT